MWVGGIFKLVSVLNSIYHIHSIQKNKLIDNEIPHHQHQLFVSIGVHSWFKHKTIRGSTQRISFNPYEQSLVSQRCRGNKLNPVGNKLKQRICFLSCGIGIFLVKLKTINMKFTLGQ
jgi:hypothetical protein